MAKRKKRRKKVAGRKKKRRGKKRRKAGGHVPIEILNRRLRKLNAIVAKRGGGKAL